MENQSCWASLLGTDPASEMTAAGVTFGGVAALVVEFEREGVGRSMTEIQVNVDQRYGETCETEKRTNE